MSKRLSIFIGISLFSLLVHAQLSQKDSLELRRILSSDGEVKINKRVINEIDFGSFSGKQEISESKSALDFDVSLPKVFPDRNKLKLTLRPYTAQTKFNYDPIYQKKIRVDADTWKTADNGVRMKLISTPSNWAKTIADPGIRGSLEEIEATGIRYNPLAERANNMAVGTWRNADGSSVGGATLSGDFMAPFTKEFWDKKGRKRRARTLEVLQNYGDSITTQIREEIKKAITH